MGIFDTDLDLMMLSHLDCDHVNGIKLVSGAKQIITSKDEIVFATNGSFVNRIRYNSQWLEGTKLEGFDGTELNDQSVNLMMYLVMDMFI